MALLDIESRFELLNLGINQGIINEPRQRLFDYSKERDNCLPGSVERDNDTEGKVFIGGISWQTSPEMLRSHFGMFGNIVDISLMKDKYTGLPRGFGFIKFDSPLAVDLTLAQTEHIIDGRCVDVKRAVSRSEAPGPGKGSRHQDGHKVFVGGLAPTVTVIDFRLYFENFGEVSDAIVMYDRQTQRSRGFGFVTFRDEYVVNYVLMRSHEIHGKFVDVKPAEPRDSRKFIGSPNLMNFRALPYLPLSSPHASSIDLYSPRRNVGNFSFNMREGVDSYSQLIENEYDIVSRKLDMLLRKPECRQQCSELPTPSSKPGFTFSTRSSEFGNGAFPVIDEPELFATNGSMYFSNDGDINSGIENCDNRFSRRTDYLQQF